MSSVDELDPGRAPDPEQTPDSVPTSGGARLLGSASVLAAGNIASRLLGLVRESVVASLFGTGLVISALRVGASVPIVINDLLINGQLSAVVVPVLTSYRVRGRAEFWRAASVLVTVAALATGLAGIAVFFLAEPIAWLLGGGLGGDGVAIVVTSLHYLAPAVTALGLVGIVTGVLYAQERFGVTALAMASFNAGFIVALLLLYDRLGAFGFPAAITLAAMLQLAMLSPGLRGGQLRLALDFRHPALRRVLVLYLPILAGLLIEQGKNVVDTRLATEAGPAAYGVMQYATRLVQFPHGLVAVAISIAILPTLSASFARSELSGFSRVLARGLRLVLALALPAAAGLAVLAQPAVAVVYEHGTFGGPDRIVVALALVVYLIGLPFASIDWPLNYAFYARQNTLVPAAVGVVSVAAYLLVAVTLGPVLNLAGLAPAFVFLGLVLADSVKHVVHAGIMLALVERAVGRAALEGVGRTALGALAATVLMVLAVWLVDRTLAGLLSAGFGAWLIRLVLGGVVGLVVYVPLAARLGVAEVLWVAGVVRQRLAAG